MLNRNKTNKMKNNKNLSRKVHYRDSGLSTNEDADDDAGDLIEFAELFVAMVAEFDSASRLSSSSTGSSRDLERI